MTESGSRIKKTIINTVAGITKQGISVILSFLLRTVFIHTLGIQYTGVSSVFSDIFTILSLSELGIGTAIATALYEPLKTHDETRIHKLMLFYRNAYRIITVFIMIAGCIMLPFLDYLITDVPGISEDIRVIFILYIIKTAVSYLFIYKSALLSADQKQYIVKFLETVCTIVRYTVEIICLVIFKQFMIYLIIEIISTIVQNFVVTERVQKEYPYAFQKYDQMLTNDEKRSLFKDIKGLAMYQISAAVGNSIDNIMVSGLISTSIVGFLSNYILIRKQIENIVKQFFGALIPSIGNLSAEKNSEKQYLVFNRVFYLSFIIVNFCSTSLFVMFNPFIRLWLGEEYLLEINVPFIIAFDFFLYILLQAIASFRTANGLFVKGQYRPLITTILNIFLTYFMIKRYGIFGAILATVICRLVTQWYDPYILFKYVFKKPFYKFYLKYWFYIVIFLTGLILTSFIANLCNVKDYFLNAIVRCIICIIIPNIWIVLLSIRTNEFRYFIDFAKTVCRDRGK